MKICEVRRAKLANKKVTRLGVLADHQDSKDTRANIAFTIEWGEIDKLRRLCHFYEFKELVWKEKGRYYPSVHVSIEIELRDEQARLIHTYHLRPCVKLEGMRRAPYLQYWFDAAVRVGDSSAMEEVRLKVEKALRCLNPAKLDPKHKDHLGPFLDEAFRKGLSEVVLSGDLDDPFSAYDFPDSFTRLLKDCYVDRRGRPTFPKEKGDKE